jgi:hypothetical protein
MEEQRKPPGAPDDWFQWGPIAKLAWIIITIGLLVLIRVYVAGPFGQWVQHQLFP